MVTVDRLTREGLGLDYHDLRLDVTTDGWVKAGSQLRDDVATMLGNNAAGVEQIGSSAVVGLLAKPIIDLAVGMPHPYDISSISLELESAGWIYRGDAGNQGGHVFVLEARPGFRVAHIHVVIFGGDQWRNYVDLRHVLRSSAEARSRYALVKVALAAEFAADREAYTAGKTAVVHSLLSHDNP